SRFEKLYRRIDASLEDHLRKETGTPQLSTGDEAWFRALMVSFHDKFKEWPSLGPGDVYDYLRLFESRGVDPLLRLAAHAFLHIGYDLPRVIAKSLAARPGL